MKRKFILLLILLPFFSFGQGKEIPINISLFNEATALPFTRFLTFPVHPGIQVGTEFNYKIKTQTRFYQTANISYFYHNYLNQGIGLYTEVAYEYRLKFGLAFTGLFGLGYMHTFATTEEFTFTNGQYEKKTDRGNARLFPSLSLDIGYYIIKDKPNSPKIFLRYQSWIEFPYSPGFIPAMTHINLHVGTKFFIVKKDKSK